MFIIIFIIYALFANKIFNFINIIYKNGYFIIKPNKNFMKI